MTTAEIAGAIKDFGPPVAWIIAAGGLVYNNYAANHRERRKEFRSEIDAIATTVKEVVKKLAAYYSQPERGLEAKSIELEVKALFREIDLKSDRISKRKFQNEVASVLKQCAVAHERFFDLATSKYFESDDWPSRDITTAHLLELHVQGLVLIEDMYSLFLKEYDGVS